MCAIVNDAMEFRLFYFNKQIREVTFVAPLAQWSRYCSDLLDVTGGLGTHGDIYRAHAILPSFLPP